MSAFGARPPLWNVPYQRNPFFTGREETLLQLHRMLRTADAVALCHPLGISGLGGIGKTQTALEYVYRYGTNYDAVFWVRANSTATLISGFMDLATLLQLPERNEQDQNVIVEAVLRWFHLHGGWMLVLDNLEDLSAAEPFIPRTGSGHILFTTREHALERIAQRLEVQSMQPEMGALLVLRRAHLLSLHTPLERASDANRRIACTISEELNGLPLALDQAGAYIATTSCTLEEYLSLYQVRRQELLHLRGSSDQSYPASVATTWSLSFEKVRQANPAAAELLNFCAFLASDAIPEELLTAGAAYLGDILTPVAMHPLQLDQAYKDVLRFSLLQREPEAHTLTIHRLVQAVIQDNMISSERTRWCKQTIQALDATFPEVITLVWPQCERLLAHVLVVINSPEDETECGELGRCLRKAAVYLYGRAQYEKAESLFQRAIQITQRQQDPDPAELPLLLNGLAQLFIRQGKYTQAEPLLQQALQLIDDQLDSDPSLKWITFNNLGQIALQEGKYAQAELFIQQALQLVNKIVEADASPAAMTVSHLVLNNLGTIYFFQGKDIQAESQLQQARLILERLGQFAHQDSVLVIANLGLLYVHQGKYAEAEAVVERALQISAQELGPDHPNSAGLLASLAYIYIDQHKYAEAEQPLQQALQIYEQLPDTEPADVIGVSLLMADLSDQQDQFARTETYLQNALQIGEFRLGSNHPLVAVVLSRLGDVYRKQGKHAEGESMLQRALYISEQLGLNDVQVATILIDLASIYKAQKKYAQAEPLLLRALQIREQLLGPDHLDVASALNTLANLYYYQGKRTKAEALYQRTLKIREQQLGPSHLDVATTLNDLANLYEEQVLSAKAEALYQRALKIREQLLGPDHLDVATILSNLANFYRNRGMYAMAEPFYERALQIREKKLGSEHVRTQKLRKYAVASRGCRNILYICLGIIFLVCGIIWLIHKFDPWGWGALVLTVLSGLRLTVGGLEYFSEKKQRATVPNSQS